MDKQPLYRLMFRPVARERDPQGIHRIRQLLKFAGRSLELRCLYASTASSSECRPWPGKEGHDAAIDR